MRATVRPFFAALVVAFIAAGCNNADRSDTKGVDNAPDAHNAREPRAMGSPATQAAPDEQPASSAAASAAQDQPKSTH